MMDMLKVLCLMMPLAAQADGSITKEKLYFSIPQQRADHSLTHVAELANITLIFPFDEFQKVKAKGIEGVYTVEEALKTLLQGTGYALSMGSNGNAHIVLRKTSFGGIDSMLKLNKLSKQVMSVIALSTMGEATYGQSDQAGLEEVVVTGIRQSLQAAADLKRNSDYIQDSIIAEDIGKFPDGNVAEALQRISGVSIDRNGGEGQKITVRGFGPQFNTVLVNGRRMASDAEGRAFNFDMLSAELIGGADVYKTSNVSLQEGGIGSTINLKTQRPLDIGEFKAVASLKGLYEDKSEDTAPNLFGFVSNTFADDKVGVLFSLSHQERIGTVDSSITSWSPDSLRWESWNLGDADLWRFADGQGNGAGTYLFQRQHNFMRTVEDRTRTGLTSTIQFEPSDNLSLTFDAMYTDFEIATTAISRISHRNRPDIHNMVVDSDNVVRRYDMIEGTMNVFQARNRPASAEQYGLNLEWGISDSLTANFDFSNSSSENPAAGKDYYVVIRASETLQRIDNSQGTDAPLMNSFLFTPATTDVNGDGLVNQFDYTLGDEVTVADVNDQASWFTQREGFTFEDDITEAKVDFDWQLNAGALRKLNFGAISSSQEKTRVNMRSADPQFYRLRRVPLPASLLSSENRAGFLSAANGNFATDSIQFDPEEVLSYLSDPATLAVRDSDTGLHIAPLGELPAGTSQAAFNAIGGYDAIVDPSRSYNVEEDIFSAYINGTFEFEISDMPVVVNAGLRYTETEVESTGSNRVFADLSPVGNTGDVLRSTLTDPVTVTATAKYDDILPSIDARLEVSDELIVRAAFSETLTRPDMTSLNPAPAFAQQIRVSDLSGVAGNPDLQPFKSENIDLSVEWYYSDSGYLTVGYFQKDIDGFIVSGSSREGFDIPVPNSLDDVLANTEIDPDRIQGNTIFLDIVRPRNLEKTGVDGWEVSFQHVFEYLPGALSNIGVLTNLTFVNADDEFDVNRFDNNIALPGLGDSQNIALFYDDGVIEARIAYNNREEFFTRFQGVEPWFTEQYDQLDARMAWNINEKTQVYVEGINLTDSFTRQRGRYEGQFLSLYSSGPRYAFGVRANF